MSGSVTVPGSTPGSTITLTFGNTFNLQLANAISGALGKASTGGHLNVITATNNGTGGASVSGSPISGDVNELLILPGFTGHITVPGGKSGFQFVIDESVGTDTIFGASTESIMAGGGTHVIIDPAVVTLGDTTSGSINLVSTTGSGDNVAVGNGTNTVIGIGGGTISGGTGKNLFDLTGQATPGYVINSQGGVGTDTIQAGAGSDTIRLMGQTTVGALVKDTAGGALNIRVGDGTDTLGGRRDTIAGGPATALTVNSSLGRTMLLFASNVGPTSVRDLSVGGDTIDGGAGLLSATIGGSTTVTGGATVTGQGAFVVVGSGGANVVDIADGTQINAGFASTGAVNATVSGAGVAVVAGDGGANVTLTGTAANAFVYGAGTAGGSALNVIDNGTADVAVALDSAAFSVRAAGSGGAFFGGSATTNINVTGTNNLVETQYGTGGLSATVTGSGNGLVVGNSVSGGTIIIGPSSSNTIIYPLNTTAAPVNVIDGGTGDLVNGAYGTGKVNVTITGSNDTVAAGTGATNVSVSGTGGAAAFNFGGLLNFVGGSGSATVTAENWFNASPSSARTTIFGASGGDITFLDGSSPTTPGALYYQAGSGNETLDASGSTTQDTLAGGSGSVTMKAGSGLTMFLFAASADGGLASNDVVIGTTGGDIVNIQGYASGSGSVAASGASSVLSLSDGTQITFTNTGTTALLSAIHYT